MANSPQGSPLRGRRWRSAAGCLRRSTPPPSAQTPRELRSAQLSRWHGWRVRSDMSSEALSWICFSLSIHRKITCEDLFTKLIIVQAHQGRHREDPCPSSKRRSLNSSVAAKDRKWSRALGWRHRETCHHLPVWRRWTPSHSLSLAVIAARPRATAVAQPVLLRLLRPKLEQ